MSAPLPPPHPAPGWDGDRLPPEGFRWEWARAHDGWQLDPTARPCRWTVGPGHKTCKRPSVATLNRGRGPMVQHLWGYCEKHLYGRHVHDGAIWDCHLVPDDGGAE